MFAAAAIVLLAVANFGYGVVCERKCDELCAKQGFPGSSWTSATGFWLRALSGAGGSHGSCLCSSGPGASAARPAAFKEVVLRFE
jgi:hypothetical protein